MVKKLKEQDALIIINFVVSNQLQAWEEVGLQKNQSHPLAEARLPLQSSAMNGRTADERMHACWPPTKQNHLNNQVWCIESAGEFIPEPNATAEGFQLHRLMWLRSPCLSQFTAAIELNTSGSEQFSCNADQPVADKHRQHLSFWNGP